MNNFLMFVGSCVVAMAIMAAVGWVISKIFGIRGGDVKDDNWYNY